MDDHNLYLVKTIQGTEFYVLATDQTTAAQIIKRKWNERKWLGEGTAKIITLIANQGAYRKDFNGPPELLIQLHVSGGENDKTD